MFENCFGRISTGITGSHKRPKDTPPSGNSKKDKKKGGK